MDSGKQNLRDSWYRRHGAVCKYCRLAFYDSESSPPYVSMGFDRRNDHHRLHPGRVAVGWCWRSHLVLVDNRWYCDSVVASFCGKGWASAHKRLLCHYRAFSLCCFMLDGGGFPLSPIKQPG